MEDMQILKKYLRKITSRAFSDTERFLFNMSYCESKLSLPTYKFKNNIGLSQNLALAFLLNMYLDLLRTLFIPSLQPWGLVEKLGIVQELKHRVSFFFAATVTTSSKTTVIRQHRKLERAVELQPKAISYGLNTLGAKGCDHGQMTQASLASLYI